MQTTTTRNFAPGHHRVTLNGTDGWTYVHIQRAHDEKGRKFWSGQLFRNGTARQFVGGSNRLSDVIEDAQSELARWIEDVKAA